MRIRKVNQRGQGNYEWLKARHTFSFSRYLDKNWMGSGPLLVMNEDVIAPKRGFESHGHKNMEILTFILKGILTHKDSMGNQKEIKAGEFQLMTAGSGVIHSEKNESKLPVHLYQIWIEPNVFDIKPNYQQESFENNPADQWTVIATNSNKSPFFINQDIEILYGKFNSNNNIELTSGWLQIIEGEIMLDGQIVSTSDGIELDTNQNISIIKPCSLIKINY
jgi:redox-sensitive bicupin YhaK (pirin superfamily)